MDRPKGIIFVSIIYFLMAIMSLIWAGYNIEFLYLVYMGFFAFIGGIPYIFQASISSIIFIIKIGILPITTIILLIISGIFLTQLKPRGRILGIITSSLLLLESILFFRDLKYIDLNYVFFYPSISTKGIIFIIMFSLFFIANVFAIIYLTRPKVKEAFKQNQVINGIK